MQYLRITARILLGMVFIFSGFVKGIDPVGSAIKFGEYFEVFHLPWLENISLVLSIFQSTAELLIGICLVIGLRMKITAWAVLVFMAFFTILTFYSAIFNPVSDCGCFGDALVLTNWQTFYKNIFLLILAVIVFILRKNFKPYGNAFKEWIIILLFATAGSGIFIFCYRHLPLVDFRPYSVGSHIPSKMIIPSGAPSDQYNTKLYYQKDGITKEFTLQNYPWRDTTWKWVKTQSDLIKKGYTPPIHGFSITTEGGDDLTNKVLADTGYSFIFISNDLSAVNSNLWFKVINYYEYSIINNHNFYFLTSSATENARNTKISFKLPFDFMFTDQTALKTIMRANPGLMLLKDGVIIGLWHYNDFPATEYFNGSILSKIITSYNNKNESEIIVLLIMVFVLFLVVLIKFK